MDFSQRLKQYLGPGAAAIAIALSASAGAATLPLYENNAPLVSPPAIAPRIDARVWVNRSIFDIFSTLPYESLNTGIFTNSISGQMLFDPGVRFFRNTNGFRYTMDTWVNEGSIATDHGTLLTGGFFVADSTASILQVQATNIHSKGPLSSGAHGVVHLEGKRIQVPRIGIRTGSSGAGVPVGGTQFLGTSNFVNDVGIEDAYWAAGINNAQQTAPPMDLTGGFADFNLPNPSSPLHDVISRSFGFQFTNTTIVPGGFFFFGTNLSAGFQTNGYAAAVHRTTVSPTNSIVQIVFYPTNSDPLSATEVRFSQFGRGAARAVVAFHTAEFDIATQQASTNSVYLVDALATTTNVFLSRNTGFNTRRPSTYLVTRTAPNDYYNGVPGNSTYSDNLVSGPQYVDSTVTNTYAAYSARIFTLGSSPSGSIPYNVTNVPGRVAIIGDEVNLDQTRIRSESAVIIKTSNLISNRLATVDAPLLNFDVRTVQPTLLISNLAPVSVRRFSGDLRMWSGRWQNQEVVTPPSGLTVTNTILFHVLIVESFLQGEVPVVLNEFAVRGTNHVIADSLNIARSILVEGTGLDLQNGLSLPYGYSLGASNLQNVLHFTNRGTINMNGLQAFGTDRPAPYTDYVNSGTNYASSHAIRALNLQNEGCIAAVGGTLNIDTLRLDLSGTPFVGTTNLVTNVFVTVSGSITSVFPVVTVESAPPKLSGPGEVRLFTRDFIASNAVINAGYLLFSATNSLTDGGMDALNTWTVTNGFQAVRVPATSSLLGTEVQSVVPRFAISEHVWPAIDRGAVPAGFTNNLALGKLTLDGDIQSTFAFHAPGATNALYVEYLEFRDTATNYTRAFEIDPNFTIYYATANVSVEKLDGVLGGRFRWVPEFAGPRSSTNIFYESTGQTYTFNSALVRSKDLDSDGDGIVNADDPEPVYVPENAALTVALAAAPERGAVLRWSALAYSRNTLEFKASANEGAWQVLTNFTHGPQTSPVSILDPLPATGASRVYRLRVDPVR